MFLVALSSNRFCLIIYAAAPAGHMIMFLTLYTFHFKTVARDTNGRLTNQSNTYIRELARCEFA